MPFTRSQFFAITHSFVSGLLLFAAAQVYGDKPLKLPNDSSLKLLDAERPSFVVSSLNPSFKAQLMAVESTTAADIVFLAGGLRDGFQPGMVCEVTRGQQQLGQIIIIEASSTRSAALITSLQQHSIFKTGDMARVQTIKNI